MTEAAAPAASGSTTSSRDDAERGPRSGRGLRDGRRPWPRRVVAVVGALALVATAEAACSNYYDPPSALPVPPVASASTSHQTTQGTAALTVTAVYEPLCSTTGQPNATIPPTPDGPGDCTPRPLDGVAVTVKSEGGTTVAAVTTDDIGRAVLRIDPGSYVVTGGPAGGPTITPQPLQVVVTAPGTTVTLHYQSNLE